MSEFAFKGLETKGLMLGAHIPRAKAIELAGGEYEFLPAVGEGDRVRAALMVVRIEGLTTWGIPYPRWTYPEAVWMLSLPRDSYLAVKAHTPLFMLGALSLMDRYNTDTAALELDAANVKVKAGAGAFEAVLKGESQVDSPLISNLWTRNNKGNLYRIPWGGDPARRLERVRCNVQKNALGLDVFGEDLVLDADAVFFEDRPHRCAPARAEAPPFKSPLKEAFIARAVS